jgi:hypothetical protein
MNRYPVDTEERMQVLYRSLSEKDRRRYAAIEAEKVGHGGLSYVAKLFGCEERNREAWPERPGSTSPG